MTTNYQKKHKLLPGYIAQHCICKVNIEQTLLARWNMI